MPGLSGKQTHLSGSDHDCPPLEELVEQMFIAYNSARLHEAAQLRGLS